MKFRTMIAAALAAAALASCASQDNPAGPTTWRRPLDPAVWTGKAVCYSGYRAGESPGTATYPTEAEIKEDLDLLVSGGWKLIRLYDTSTNAARTLKVISDNAMPLKVMQGAWIAGPKATSDATNAANLDAAIAMANQYPDIIVAVSVGNETLVDWSTIACPPADLAAYISYLRAKVSVPVTTDDNWEPFSFKTETGAPYDTLRVAQVCDFLSIHTYALWDSDYDLWDWKQSGVAEADRAGAMMDAALAYAKKNYRAVKDALAAAGQGDLPVLIGETGWTDAGFTYRGNAVNEKMYYDRLQDWVYGAGKEAGGPVACFYFEAFNEPWKGADDNWGLFDADRKAKYVLKDLFPAILRASDAALTAADAVYYVPPPAAQLVDKATYVAFSDRTIDPATMQTAMKDPGSGALWQRWDAWDNGLTAGYPTIQTDSAPGDGPNAIEITPKPAVWGWGLALSVTVPEDMHLLSATGNLHFSIKTTYSGKLEVGFATGTAVAKTACDVYLAIAPGQYGYQNDGAWHEVTIPMTAIKAKAAPAYGMPSTATLDLTKVTSTFTVADRYAVTGNASQTAKVLIDNIYWTN